MDRLEIHNTPMPGMVSIGVMSGFWLGQDFGQDYS